MAKEAYESLLQTENLPTQVKAATLQQLGKCTSCLELLKLVTMMCMYNVLYFSFILNWNSKQRLLSCLKSFVILKIDPLASRVFQLQAVIL